MRSSEPWASHSFDRPLTAASVPTAGGSLQRLARCFGRLLRRWIGPGRKSDLSSPLPVPFSGGRSGGLTQPTGHEAGARRRHRVGVGVMGSARCQSYGVGVAVGAGPRVTRAVCSQSRDGATGSGGVKRLRVIG